MKKPSWFRLIDLVSITFGGLLTTGALVYALVGKAQGPAGWPWIFVATAAAFFGVYFRFAWARKKWLDTFRWYPTYGFMVQCENWESYSNFSFDSEVLPILAAWSDVHPNVMDIIKREVKWVWFKKNLNEVPLNPASRKVKGVTIAGSYTMMVDYDSPGDTLDVTAFAHELGHVIHGNATGNWNQEDHHRFMEKHGLS